LLHGHIKAVKLIVIVVESCTSRLDCVQGLVLAFFVSIVCFFGFLARYGHWPGRKWLDKIGRVRIVHHGHCAERAVEGADKALHLGTTRWDRAEVEDLCHVSVGVGLIEQQRELVKASFYHGGTLLVCLTVVAGRDIVIGIRIHVAFKEENRCAGGQCTLEHVRVLHSEPGREHATVGTASNDDSTVLEALLIFEVEHELNVVHHSLLDREVFEVVAVKTLITKWHGCAEVAMLTENNKGTELLC